MKRKSILSSIVFLFLIVLLMLTACGNSEFGLTGNNEKPMTPPVMPAPWSDYIGRQYAGKDPWGNYLSIILKWADGNKVSFEYEAVIGEGEYIRTFLTESSGEPQGGTMPFHITAVAKEYEEMHCDYSGSLTLKDGSLFVTYDAGSVIEESPEGGSAGYQAFFLEGENKTVELRADYSGTA